MMRAGSGPSNAWMALRYSSTIPMRLVLALAALLFALAIVATDGGVAWREIYARMLYSAPAWQWSLVFAADGALLAWRVLDGRQRVGVTRVVNAATCAIWIGYVCASIVVLGRVSPDMAAEIALSLGSVWITLRTDLTQSDRETA